MAAVRSLLIGIAAGWSLFLIAATALLLREELGDGAIAVSAIPLALTFVVAALLYLGDRCPRVQKVARAAAITVTALLAAAAVTSFILPALAALPTCGLLLAATLDDQSPPVRVTAK